MIICPYCLSKHNLSPTNNVCPSCGEEVPPKYIQATRKTPPVFIVTVGMTQHGKSTLLDSIAVTVENLGKISDGTFHSYLDAYTFDSVRGIRKQVLEGKVPDSTTKDAKPRPLLIGIHNFLGVESNTLVIYDLAGEVFDDIQTVGLYANAIIHAQTIWFLVSLADLEEDKSGRSIFDLIEVYLAGMDQLGTPTRGRDVLIIYTKSDKIVHKLPSAIRGYMGKDPYRNLKDMKRNEANLIPFDDYSYIQEMRAISQELKDYTMDDVEGGGALINRIKSSKMTINFAITSATGSDVDNRQAGVILTRFRVLDPLLWSLMPSGGGEPPATQAIILVDSTAKMFTTGDKLGMIYDELSAQRMDINTYYMGNMQPAFSALRPDGVPKRKYSPLVGLALDQLNPATTYVMIITEANIHDLYDYIYSDWHENLFVVTTADFPLTWQHKLEVDDASFDARDIVERFMTIVLRKD
ncbi:MAG: hypothetical protein SH821_16980 [Phototrophicales bacterium]|nr:hypothetical protein [Phototrophicales bacterium]